MSFPSKWSDWMPLTRENLARHPMPEKGIYLIRARTRSIGRVLGSSPLLYIGVSRKLGAGSVARRLQQAITPHAPHPVEPRLRDLLTLGESVDFCCAETDDPEAAENSLLAFFERLHLELPAFNRQGSRR